jgi:hypothetical protein
MSAIVSSGGSRRAGTAARAPGLLDSVARLHVLAQRGAATVYRHAAGGDEQFALPPGAEACVGEMLLQSHRLSRLIRNARVHGDHGAVAAGEDRDPRPG